MLLLSAIPNPHPFISIHLVTQGPTQIHQGLVLSTQLKLRLIYPFISHKDSWGSTTVILLLKTRTDELNILPD